MRCSKCLFSLPSKLSSQPCCSQECQQQLSSVPRPVPSSHADHGVHALGLAETGDTTTTVTTHTLPIPDHSSRPHYTAKSAILMSLWDPPDAPSHAPAFFSGARP